ncbi:MAG: hypothetical protein QM756_05160 [Polyangiaceae bacterium]
MGAPLFILLRFLSQPWDFLSGELKIRRAVRQLNTMVAAPWGTYDRWEIRSASRYVRHTIEGSNHPPYWEAEWHRAVRIGEDMRHPKGIGCSPTCRHNRANIS